jgi:hypothetical protein
MHHQRYVERRHEPQRVLDARRLFPPGLELEWLVAQVHHVVGVGQHHKLEQGGWQEGAVERRGSVLSSAQRW